MCGLFPKLDELRERRAGLLSGGEQQMLTIARTLMCNPELLLLDEPSEGLAPLVVESLLEQVRRLKQEGLTILLAEQGVEFSLALADRVYVLEKGAVVHQGPAAALRDDAALRDRLLDACDYSEEITMPFVTIQILEGHPQERKDEMSRRVTEAIAELAKLPKEAVWVVFEDVDGRGLVRRRRHRRLAEEGRQAVNDATSGLEVLAEGFLFTEGPLWDARARRLLFTDIPGDLHRAMEPATAARRVPPRRATRPTASPGTGRAGCSRCEHATSRLTRTEPDGRMTVLAAATRARS